MDIYWVQEPPLNGDLLGMTPSTFSCLNRTEHLAVQSFAGSVHSGHPEPRLGGDHRRSAPGSGRIGRETSVAEQGTRHSPRDAY